MTIDVSKLVWPATALAFACGAPDPASQEQAGACAVPHLMVSPGGELPPLEYRAGDIAWIDDTSLVVNDLDDRQAVTLSVPDGRELLRVGREGGGAGEFRAIGPTLPTEDGYLVTGYGRVTRFDRGGEERGTVTVPGMVTELLAWDGKRAVVLWAFPGTAGPSVGLADPISGEWDVAFAPFERDPELKEELFPGIPNPFVTAAAAPGGDVVVGQQLTYRLTRFSPTGRVVRSFGRPDLERTARSDAERERLSGRMKRIMLEAAPRLDVSDLGPVDAAFNQPRPHFTRIRFDLKDRLWVITDRNPADSTDLDVFLPDGTFGGTGSVAHRIVDLAFRGGRIAALRELLSGPAEGQFQVVVGTEGCGGEGG